MLLLEHKFKQSFQDSLNLICNCGADIEKTPHSPLHCPLFPDERLILINNIWNIDNNILNLNDSRSSEVLLFGNSSFSNTQNTSILNTTIEYIISSKRLHIPLFDTESVSKTSTFTHGCFMYLIFFLSFIFSFFFH